MPLSAYRPFILGTVSIAGPLLERCPLPDPLFFDVLDPASASFFAAVNQANQKAFGDIGMPAWVQLDCCTIPSAMIGFAEQRGDTWIPVSEYCALRTWQNGTVSGVSLFSSVRGKALGVRTKALALACYGAAHQIGVTQYDNHAVRTHVAFGPLEIIATRAGVHTRGGSFAYRLKVPARSALEALIADGPTAAVAPVEGSEIHVPLGDGVADRVAAVIEKHGRVGVVAPGHLDGALTLTPL